MSRKINLVGAYERDNLGDALLGLVTRRLLRADSVCLAPFAAAPNEGLAGEPVLAYPAEFGPPDAGPIWVVGGEVGGVFTWDNATAMLGSDHPGRRSATVRGSEPLPYLPRPTAFPAMSASPYVINSAGLSRLRFAPESIQAAARQVLCEADAVSVRDPRSAELLDSWGIAHTLAPDIVQALNQAFPLERKPSGTAVVQMCAAELDRLGPDVVARALESSVLAERPIRFLAAGTTTGHDSVEAYETVRRHLAQLRPTLDTSVVAGRDPFALRAEIANADIFVGTSLHGRIVASAHGVPRVSFRSEKLNTYVSHWDPRQPWDVPIEHLAQAVSEAFDSEEQARQPAATLAHLAADNLARLWESVERDTDTVRLARLQRRVALLERYRQETQSPPYVAKVDRAMRLARDPRGTARKVVRRLAALISAARLTRTP